MRESRSLARLPRVIPDPGAGRAPVPTGSAPAASGPIERQLQEAYRAIADMSVAISTSSAESRENARHAATSASFSYVPRYAPVASSITVNFAGCCSARNSDPHNRMESVGYRDDGRQNLAPNHNADGVCGRRDCIRADSVITAQWRTICKDLLSCELTFFIRRLTWCDGNGANKARR